MKRVGIALVSAAMVLAIAGPALGAGGAFRVKVCDPGTGDTQVVAIWNSQAVITNVNFRAFDTAAGNIGSADRYPNSTSGSETVTLNPAPSSVDAVVVDFYAGGTQVAERTKRMPGGGWRPC